MRKGFFLVAILAFTAFSVSAQNDLNKFLGSWKLVQIEGKKDSQIPTIDLTVSHINNQVQVERLTKDITSNNTFRDLETYKDDLSGGFKRNDRGALINRQIKFINSNKILISKSSESVNTFNADRIVRTKSVQKEYWTISPDGKTLSIDYRSEFRNSNDDQPSVAPLSASAFASRKMIFEKQ